MVQFLSKHKLARLESQRFSTFPHSNFIFLHNLMDLFCKLHFSNVACKYFELREFKMLAAIDLFT